MRVKIDLNRIKNWDDFHDVFYEAMGFPGFYGRNMDAWIDCLSYIDDPEAGMSKIIINCGETLELELNGMSQFGDQNPEILYELLLCSGFVNERFIDSGSNTRISIIAT